MSNNQESCCDVVSYWPEMKSWIISMGEEILVADFCPSCGATLNNNGTIESREEFEKKAAEVDWSDCPYCAYNEKAWQENTNNE